MNNRLRILAVLASILSIVLSTGPVNAQTASTAERSCVTVDFGGARLIVRQAERTDPNPVSLPAGGVEIASARASDGYPSRGSITQNSERYEIEFLSASGDIIATSAPTDDVADFLVFAEWTGALGSVTLSEPAVAVRAHHRPDLPGDNTPQSVRANEVTFCFEVSAPVCGDDGVTTNPDGSPCVSTTTTSPTTTVTTQTETSTTTEGDEVAGPTTSTTTAPSTTVPSTTVPSTTASSTTVPSTTVPSTTPSSMTETEAPTSTTSTATSTTAPPTTAVEEVAGPIADLASTGSNTSMLLGLGALILAAGFGLLAARRRPV